MGTDETPGTFVARPTTSYIDRTPQQARADRAAAALARSDDGLESIHDRVIEVGGRRIPIRVYRPRGEGRLPVVVYFHGGGWVVGSIETHDATTSAIAARSGCVVVSVEYRLAPEDPFPAGVEDCYDATVWVAANGASLGVDAARLAVAGDSAGGNLAAAVCVMARDRGGPPIRLQVLVYPATDHYGDWSTYREFGDGRHGLGAALMKWFSDLYLPRPEDASDVRASPVRATSVGSLPAALVITAEYDPLRDEGEAYGARLADAGVPATVHRYPGTAHGFFALRENDDRQAALDEVARAIVVATRT
jgi:acetyl esterase